MFLNAAEFRCFKEHLMSKVRLVTSAPPIVTFFSIFVGREEGLSTVIYVMLSSFKVQGSESFCIL